MTLHKTVYSMGSNLIRTVGSVSDTVSDAGVYTKNISDWTDITGDLTWYISTDYTGYKQVQTIGYLTALGGKGGGPALPILGKVMKFGGDNLTWRSTSNANSFNFNSSNLNISVSDSETGFPEAWDGTTSFTGMTFNNLVKGFFYGWKLTTANLNVASCEWTGMFSGTVKTGASGYADVISTADVGLVPYKMLFQLTTPTTVNLELNVGMSKSLRFASYGFDNLAL